MSETNHRRREKQPQAAGQTKSRNPKRNDARRREEQQPAVDAAIVQLLSGDAEDAAMTAVLSELCAAAKKKTASDAIDAACSDRSKLYACLKSSRPKTRKNAARLLGALGRGRDASALAAALTAEQTLLVIPSLLLALGAVGGSRARSALAAYPVPAANDETEVGHVREIRLALAKAMNRFDTEAFPPLNTLERAQAVLLTAPAGFSDLLREELRELGYSPAPHPQGAVVKTADLVGLLRARCAVELLLPLTERVLCTPEAVAKAFSEPPALPYRLELRGYAGDRTAFLTKTAELLGGTNNPSHYAWELRIDCDGTHAALYRKPCTVPDKRYGYRSGTVSASIHPATAACLVRFARKHAPAKKEEPHVLDPFCGSGTLLFERELFGPCESLQGVDLTENAIHTAKLNAKKGYSDARFVQKDCLKFTPSVPADELYANLPFGNRVGSHENNEQLYRSFIGLLPKWLAKDGFALLYTVESNLLERCIRHTPELTVRERMRTEAGGLTPWVFLITRA